MNASSAASFWILEYRTWRLAGSNSRWAAFVAAAAAGLFQYVWNECELWDGSAENDTSSSGSAMSIVQYWFSIPGYLAAFQSAWVAFGSFLRMLILMLSGFAAACSTCAIVCESCWPASDSNVAVKPFGTVDFASSALALATLYWMPGEFLS